LISEAFLKFGVICVGHRVGTPDASTHYLVRNPSGRFVFRPRVPRVLQALTKRSVIKQALCTTDARLAQQHVLSFATAMLRFSNRLVGKGEAP